MRESEQLGKIAHSNLKTYTDRAPFIYCRASQLELKQCIESLAEELKRVTETQQHTVDLEVYLKKLLSAKQRVTVLSNILQVSSPLWSFYFF